MYSAAGERVLDALAWAASKQLQPNRDGKARGRGACFYVPKKVGPQLVGLVGEDGAKWLVGEFGGESLALADPVSRYARRLRDDAVRREFMDGASPIHLAALFGLSERQARNICRGVPVPSASQRERYRQELREHSRERLREIEKQNAELSRQIAALGWPKPSDTPVGAKDDRDSSQD